jgi:RNA recognition motif-containing protein
LSVRLGPPSHQDNRIVVDCYIGNLPTEKVTKRDLFHIFHNHGKLAQISLKQAYGFVQFLEASACSDALIKEQGASIRGRKIRKPPCPFLCLTTNSPNFVQIWRSPNHKKAAEIQDRRITSSHCGEDLGRQIGDGVEPIVGRNSTGCHSVTSVTSLLGDGTTIVP